MPRAKRAYVPKTKGVLALFKGVLQMTYFNID